MTALDEHDNDVSGTFTADTLGLSFTVCEGCDDLFGGGLAPYFDIRLGAGSFDDALARALRVRPDTAGEGFFSVYLEDIDGTSDDPLRTGWSAAGFEVLQLDVNDVPEPGIMALSAIAATALIGRRRARRG